MAVRFLYGLLVSFIFMSLALARSPSSTPKHWYGNNWEKLQEFIQKTGSQNPSYDSSHRPVALFDWDNTVIKNDAGDAVFYWMVAHGLIKRPIDWAKTNRYLTHDAIEALNKNCGTGTRGFVPSDTNPICADTIMSIYIDGKTLGDQKTAWSQDYEPDLMEPSYAWITLLASGYTPDQFRTIAKKTIEYELHNPVGAKQKIGTKEYEAYLRVYPEMKDLIAALHTNGFDVWVITASSQYVIEVMAKYVGINSDHIIGIRSVKDKSGRLDYGLESCGTYPEGNQNVITYRKGKRCWVNKVVFGVKNGENMLDNPAPASFAAGDSDSDAFFLKDATGLRLVINRNKSELMCNAYANQDGKWIINPMFIDPKVQKTSKFDCGKYGTSDQRDSIY